MSTSEHWRKSGNDVFKSADAIFMQNGWEEKMKEAIVCYQKAMNTALHNKERASAAKNTALAALKVAEFLATVPDREKSTIENYCMAIRNFISATTFGRECQESEWIAHLESLQNSAVTSALMSLKHVPLGLPRLYTLGVLEGALPSGKWKHQVGFEIAQAAFKSGVLALDLLDHKNALNYLKTCEGPLNDLEGFSDGDADIDNLPHFFDKVTKAGISTLKSDCRLHQKLAQALWSIEKGDKCLKEGTNEHEGLHMGTVWQAVDFYQNASLLAEDISVEFEARAQSRLGRVMYLVLKWPIKARELFNSSMNLIHSEDLTRLLTTDWYKEMQSLHSKAQEESYKEEEETKHMETREIKLQLKEELKVLDAKSDKGPDDLLEYVYHRYPPNDKKMSLASNFKEHKKQAFRNALIHYHPDKVDASVYGMRSKVMSGEIAKRINQHYDKMKI